MEKIFNIINPLLPTIGVIVSAIISYAIAKLKVKNENKNAELKIQQEENRAENTAFAKLISTVDMYCSSPCGSTQNDAIQANAEFLRMARNEIKPTLVKLDSAIQKSAYIEAKILRNEIVAFYSREPQSPSNNSQRKK